MSVVLSDLDYTIKDLKLKISDDPDPFLLDILSRLMVIRENQQIVLVERAYRNERSNNDSRFR